MHNYVGIGYVASPGTGTGEVNVRNNLSYGNVIGDYANTDATISNTFSTNVSSDSTGNVGFNDWADYDTSLVDAANNDAYLTAAADSDTVLKGGDDLSGIGAPYQFDDDSNGIARVDWYCGAYDYHAPEEPEPPAPAVPTDWNPDWFSDTDIKPIKLVKIKFNLRGL